MSLKLLGVRIDDVDLNRARDLVRTFLNSDSQHKIFTPNPEILVDAHRNKSYQEILNSGDLNICDGIGVQLFSKSKITRIPGSEFIFDVCQIAEQQSKTVYLFGSGDQYVLDQTQKKLLKEYPRLKIVGVDIGPKLDDEAQGDSSGVINDIIMSSPDILFVALSHGKQEKWIHENLPSLPSVKIAMGVGGSFDFISGKIKRAPKLVSAVGMEWLWRLVLQPKRLKRIINAVIVFPYLCLRNLKSIK